MALKHTFQSAKADGGDATQVQPSNWNADHVVDTDGVVIVADATTPTAPAAGFMTFFAKLLGQFGMPGYIGAVGSASLLQSFLGQKRVSWFQPVNAQNTTSGGVLGLTFNSLGTLTARTAANTTFFTSISRLGVVTAASAGSRAMLYTLANFWRGNTAGAGGFKIAFRFGGSDAATVANANMFVGLSAASTVGSGSTEPSASLNIIGLGNDSTEANLSIYTNDGSGTATKTGLGANFPSNTLSTDAYELILCALPNGSDIAYQVTRLNTGHIATGTVSSDLPVNTQMLIAIFMRGNMSTALAVGIDVMSLYAETEM